MTNAFLVLLLGIAALAWVIDSARCKHEHVQGLENYFDEDAQAFVHLKRCDGCGALLITTER